MTKRRFFATIHIMRSHVAILKKPYVDLILAGRKTVESRLTRTRQPPFGQVKSGQVIHIKQSGGPFAVVAVAGKIEQYHQPGAAKMRELYRRLEPSVCGGQAYWRAKHDCAFVTFIHLARVMPLDRGLTYPPSSWRAWHVLDSSSPGGPGEPLVCDSRITRGGMKNNYVLTRGCGAMFDEKSFTLCLPDGQEVMTQRYLRSRIRWRGWQPYFQAANLTAGDWVRFVRIAAARYRVIFIRESAESLRTDAK